MCTFNKSRAFMVFCNFLLLACGGILATGGIFLILDTDRVLLSRLISTYSIEGNDLPYPIMYYVALGAVLMGFCLTAAGILGCWVSCLHNYCFLITYTMIIMGLLIGECTVYTLMWMWPNCLGLELRVQELIKTLKRNYGTAGNEQFTVALDLTQTTFRCCGILSANEYETSLWHLQDLGPKFTVPLSCCVLDNINDTQAYLNPQPRNTTLCQALEINRHDGYRHNRGCFSYIEEWYTQNYFVFLLVGLTVVLIQFLVLLSTVLAFTTQCKSRNRSRQPFEVEPREMTENIYHTSVPYMNRSFRQNYKIYEKT